VVRITVIKSDGRKPTRESHRDEPLSRRPSMSPLNIGPRYVDVVRMRAAAGSSHVPSLRATASLWIVSTIALNDSRRGALLLVSKLYRIKTTTASPSRVQAAMSQPSSGGSGGGNGAAIVACCRLPAIHAPSNTAAQAAATTSIPAGAIVMGPAIRGRPAKQ